MIKLSIEEKARAYDEALKVLHKYDGANIMFSQSLKEEMFPELKESDDERIRKALITFFQRFPYERIDVAGTNAKEAIAWLEKKGKNNMGISEATKQKLEDSLNKALEKETPESWNKFLDEQGEQNPTDEIGNYDHEKVFNSLISAEIKTPEESLGVDSDTYNKIVDECVFDYENANIQQNDFAPKSALAWSEEDEYCINQLIVFCENCMIPDSGAKRCADWLKFLKDRVQPQPKQEWSEEDENVISLILSICNDFLESFKISPASTRVVKEDVDKIENWLKSIRPQNTWKPSGEQMKFLWKYAEQNNYDGRILGTLYNDLKKLRGE